MMHSRSSAAMAAPSHPAASYRHEIRQAPVLRLAEIGARQQKPPMRLVRAGGPNLLPVDDPLIAAELGARHRTSDVPPAARSPEQLAPDILAGQNAQQELL